MIKIKRKAQKPVERTGTPVGAIDGTGLVNSTQDAQSALKRKLEPFTGIDSSRNYRAMYRAACEYHERHNPPRLDDDNGETYWAEAVEDIGVVSSTFDNDPFLMGLLTAIYDELEREYKRLKEG